MRSFPVFLLALSLSCVSSPAGRTERVVQNAAGLREALKELRDGTPLKMGPGEYGGGYAVSQVRDSHITALDPEQKPRFTGGNQAWHFSRCEGLHVSHLRIGGQKHNGLNTDDGGDRVRPVKGITLRHLEVIDIGPKGNFDGIKCSGLMEVVIEDCRIHGWGGQGIDFVGCHEASILDNRVEFERARVRAEISIGDATAADTFVFRGNHWTARDQPEASRPQLPVPETGGRYGPG